MSALPSQPAACPPPAPQGVEWIAVELAAVRLNVSPRRIRQRCTEEWAARGVARLDATCSWEIREDADPGLTRGRQPELIPFDCSGLAPEQRDELNRRKAIVEAWQATRSAGVLRGETEARLTAAFLARHNAEGGDLSRRTLYRWTAGYRRQGLAGLADGRWAQAADAASDPFLEEVRRLYLLPRKSLTLTVCHTMAALKAEENGWPVRSYKTCQRFIAKIPQGVLLKRRFGVEDFTNQAEPFQPRDYSTLRSNEVWVGDHHQFDVWVIGPGGKPCRPWLTAWQDARSRRIVGYTIFAHDPNSDTIIEAFRRGVMLCGVPLAVYIDNGRDYKCKALGGRPRRLRVEHDAQKLGGIFGGLGVEKTHCLPYRPQSKPIERFFGTMEERFGATWDTYCGSSPEDRPEDVADQVKAGRAPALADFAAAFSEWLENDYHHRPHFGDSMAGRTPAAIFAECLDTIRTAPQTSLDVLCLRPSEPVKVTRNGVRFDGLAYFDMQLFEHLGKQVRLRVDDRDRSTVQVYTLDKDRFICIAKMVAKIPFRASSQQVREAHANKRAARRKVRDFYADVRPHIADDLPATLIRAAAAKARPATTDGDAPPPTLTPVRTSIDDQLPAIQRAIQRDRVSVAAGSESMSLTDIGAIIRSQGRQQPAEPAPDLIELGARLRRLNT